MSKASALHIAPDSLVCCVGPLRVICQAPSDIPRTLRVKFALCLSDVMDHWRASQALFASKSRVPFGEHAVAPTHSHQEKAQGDGTKLRSLQYLPTSEMLDYRLHRS